MSPKPTPPSPPTAYSAPAAGSASSPQAAANAARTAPLPAVPPAAPSGTAPGAATQTEGVWSAAPAPAAAPPPTSTSVRSGTVAWGAFLAVLGMLLIALGVGVHLDLAKTAIVLVGGLGVLLLVLAVLPRRREDAA